MICGSTTRLALPVTHQHCAPVLTLRTDDDFERVRREGRSWGTSILVLNAARNDLGKIRSGFITGKKLGKAVRRNRARRLVREALRLRLPLLEGGWDLVWVARPAIVGIEFAAVATAVDELLKRASILPAETPAIQSRIIRSEETSGHPSPAPEPGRADSAP